MQARLPLALAAVVLASTVPAQAQLPAFPGAEGFGAVATGGRGGEVIKVTTLASSGPGSLQAALSASGPRIVVFEVSGVIEGDHTIENGDVTIAGQTAPGAGITIHGRLFGEYDYSVQNIVIRHIRVRPPPLGPGDSGGSQWDAIQLSRNSRVILDHVTVSWGSDETIDLYEATDVTVQWTTIEASGLYGHGEGSHNYGIINGPDGQRVSLHHNLCAHHSNRCPAIANGPADVVNNLVYDVRHGFVHHNPASGEIHIAGNYFRDGPSADIFPFFFDDEAGGSGDPRYWLSDNFIDDPGNLVGAVDDPWAMSSAHPTFEYMLGDGNGIDSPAEFGASHDGYVPITLDASEDVMDLVLAHAGAFPRDVVTHQTITEVRDRTGEWGAAEPSDLLEGLTPGSPPADRDDDGMPDAWEDAHGLDPDDGTDHSTVMVSGYTAIEEYVNELADSLSGMAGGGPTPGTDGGVTPAPDGGTPGGADGGSGGGGGTDGGTAGGGGADGSSGGDPGADPGDDRVMSGGCSVTTAGAPLGWLALLLLAFARPRRRRA